MKKFIIFFLSFLFLLPSVFALGVSPGVYEIDYAPGSYDIEYRIRSNINVEGRVSIVPSGKFSEFVSAPEFLDLGARDVKSIVIRLDLPENLDDEYIGTQRLDIAFTEEEASGQGMFTTRVRIVGIVLIHFPYPGMYVEPTSFKIGDVSEGNNARADWVITSRGEADTYFNREIVVMNSDGEIVLSEDYGFESLGAGIIMSGSDVLETSSLIPARYTAYKVLTFDDTKTDSRAFFNVGTEDVNLVSFTPKTFEVDRISEFSLRIQSLWNERFDNVYATVEVGDYVTTTPSIYFEGIRSKNIKHYLNTNNLDVGEHEVLITVYFDGNSKEFTENIVITESSLRTESPFSFNYVYLVILLIIVILLIYLVKSRSK